MQKRAKTTAFADARFSSPAGGFASREEAGLRRVVRQGAGTRADLSSALASDNIFDTAADRATAEKQLREWIAEAKTTGLDWQPFITMLENHWDGILAYFDEHRSSGPVEGLNTKLRVITRRSYGIKSVTTLWTRVLLDVNWAAKKVGQTITAIRQLVGRIQAHFAGCYT